MVEGQVESITITSKRTDNIIIHLENNKGMYALSICDPESVLKLDNIVIEDFAIVISRFMRIPLTIKLYPQTERYGLSLVAEFKS